MIPSRAERSQPASQPASSHSSAQLNARDATFNDRSWSSTGGTAASTSTSSPIDRTGGPRACKSDARHSRSSSRGPNDWRRSARATGASLATRRQCQLALANELRVSERRPASQPAVRSADDSRRSWRASLIRDAELRPKLRPKPAEALDQQFALDQQVASNASFGSVRHVSSQRERGRTQAVVAIALCH